MEKLFYLLCLGLMGITWATELQPELDLGPVAYEFQWAVRDEHTGDIKSQKESRKDDKVEGIYELIDSDGYRRIVQYKADDHNGFQAIVQREPTDIKIPLPEPKKLIAGPGKILAPLAPLVHYAPAPKAVSIPIPILKQEPLSAGNYVSVARPNAQYNY